MPRPKLALHRDWIAESLTNVRAQNLWRKMQNASNQTNEKTHRDSPPALKPGAYGQSFAEKFHVLDGSAVTTPWPAEQAFAVTHVFSPFGMHDKTTQFEREEAIVVSVSLNTIPKGDYKFWTEGKFREVPFLTPLITSVTDMESDPVCFVTAPFDYIHYHVPRAGLDDIARSVGIKPIGTYRCVLAEQDTFLAQLTKLVLPMVQSGSRLSAMLLDHISLLLGAHILQRYAGLPKLPDVLRGGLAPWQKRKATEFLSENLTNNVRLHQVAKECELSVSHFARSFKETFGVSAHRWLVQKRLSHAENLLQSTSVPLIDIALQSGFSDQASFTRTFTRNFGISPGLWRKHHRN